MAQNDTNFGGGRVESGYRQMGAELQATLYQGAPAAHMSGYGLPSASEVAADRSGIDQSSSAEKDSVLAGYLEAPEPDQGRDNRDMGMDRE